jgi:hypothetical protein
MVVVHDGDPHWTKKTLFVEAFLNSVKRSENIPLTAKNVNAQGRGLFVYNSISFWILIFLGIILFCFFQVVVFYHGFLRSYDSWMLYLIASPVTFGLTIYFMYPKKHGRINIWRGIYLNFWIALFVAWLVPQLIKFGNSLADLSTPVFHEVVVQDLYEGNIGNARRGTPIYELGFQDWKQPNKICKTGIPDDWFKTLKTGDRVDLLVHRGLFGFEWVEISKSRIAK